VYLSHLKAIKSRLIDIINYLAFGKVIVLVSLILPYY
jgi:hypothetical protein